MKINIRFNLLKRFIKYSLFKWGLVLILNGFEYNKKIFYFIFNQKNTQKNIIIDKKTPLRRIRHDKNKFNSANKKMASPVGLEPTTL